MQNYRPTCVSKNCYSVPVSGTPYCLNCTAAMTSPNATNSNSARAALGSMVAAARQSEPKATTLEVRIPTTPPAADPARHGRRNADRRDGENSGGDVDYYRVFVADPKRTEPYMAECEDIIEHLGMTFAEGCAFKAIWRKAAQRTLGHLKRGADAHGVRDSEKTQYYGERMLVQARRAAKKDVQ